MKLLSTADAAKIKECSPQAICGAIKRGVLNAHQVGRSYVVEVDTTFKDWQPNVHRQQIGRDSQKG